MEPDVAVDLFQRAIKNGVKCNISTGSDDATTQIKSHTKWRSILVRSLVSKLYALRSRFFFYALRSSKSLKEKIRKPSITISFEEGWSN